MPTLSERWAARHAAQKQSAESALDVRARELQATAKLDYGSALMRAEWQLSAEAARQGAVAPQSIAENTALDERVKQLQHAEALDYATALMRAERELSGAPQAGIIGPTADGTIRSLRTGEVVEIQPWRDSQREPKALPNRKVITLSRGPIYVRSNDTVPITL